VETCIAQFLGLKSGDPAVCGRSTKGKVSCLVSCECYVSVKLVKLSWSHLFAGAHAVCARACAHVCEHGLELCAAWSRNGSGECT